MVSKYVARACVGLMMACCPLLSGAASPTRDAKELNLHNMNTGEDLRIVYKINGVYDKAALQKLNWFLRDWRKGEQHQMDPRLFDLLNELYADVGATEPVWVHCGYRSSATNEFLRRTTRGVAEESQHIQGRAMDLHIPGVPLAKLRATALRLEGGGVGYYEAANFPFIHLDVGGVRYWPRASRQYLAGLFPDGRTTLIPKDGKPLPGYDEAMAELKNKPPFERINVPPISAPAYAKADPVPSTFRPVPTPRPIDIERAAPMMALNVPVPISRPSQVAVAPANDNPPPSTFAAFAEERQVSVFDDPFKAIMQRRKVVEEIKATTFPPTPAAAKQVSKPIAFVTAMIGKTSRLH